MLTYRSETSTENKTLVKECVKSPQPYENKYLLQYPDSKRHLNGPLPFTESYPVYINDSDLFPPSTRGTRQEVDTQTYKSDI